MSTTGIGGKRHLVSISGSVYQEEDDKRWTFVLTVTGMRTCDQAVRVSTIMHEVMDNDVVDRLGKVVAHNPPGPPPTKQ
jgi:hypothetical protein